MDVWEREGAAEPGLHNVQHGAGGRGDSRRKAAHGEARERARGRPPRGGLPRQAQVRLRGARPLGGVLLGARPAEAGGPDGRGAAGPGGPPEPPDKVRRPRGGARDLRGRPPRGPPGARGGARVLEDSRRGDSERLQRLRPGARRPWGPHIPSQQGPDRRAAGGVPRRIRARRAPKAGGGRAGGARAAGGRGRGGPGRGAARSTPVVPGPEPLISRASHEVHT